MVITQGLVAVTQTFSWGRSNRAGKEKKEKKTLLFSRGGQRQSVLCQSRSLGGYMPQSEVDRRETVRLRRLTVTLYIIDGRETTTLFLRAKTAACTNADNCFNSFIHAGHFFFFFFTRLKILIIDLRSWCRAF